MKASFFSTTLGKLLSAIVIIALIILFARWLASESPSERDRVHHRAGYSVIYPEGWSPDMRHGSGNTSPGLPATRDLIYLSPDHYLGPQPALYVKRLVKSYDPLVLKQSGWTDGTFQDQPALLFSKKLKHSFVRAALFQRDSQSFEVEQTLPFAAQLDDSKWWAFLETFKYPDGPIDPEANRPIEPTTTAPNTTAPTTTGPTTGESSTQPIDF